MAERDEKGHWKKGCSGNPDRQFRAHDTGGEQHEIQRMGGHARQLQKKAERTMQERIRLLCSMPASDKAKGNLRKSGYSEDFINDADKGTVIAAAQVLKAEGGDNKAAQWVMKGLGENTDPQVNINIGTQLDYAILKPDDGTDTETI